MAGQSLKKTSKELRQKFSIFGKKKSLVRLKVTSGQERNTAGKQVKINNSSHHESNQKYQGKHGN